MSKFVIDREVFKLYIEKHILDTFARPCKYSADDIVNHILSIFDFYATEIDSKERIRGICDVSYEKGFKACKKSMKADLKERYFKKLNTTINEKINYLYNKHKKDLSKSIDCYEEGLSRQRAEINMRIQTYTLELLNCFKQSRNDIFEIKGVLSMLTEKLMAKEEVKE